MLTRREMLVGSAAMTVAATAAPLSLAQDTPAAPATPAPAPPAAAPSGPFALTTLPYAFDALEPLFDTQTMQLHHGKHHQTYVTKLNEAIAANPALTGKSLEDLIRNLNDVPEAARGAVRNFGGGHANHDLFWKTLAPPSETPRRPSGELAAAIDKKFGSFEGLTERLANAALSVFGSGWAWLSLQDDGSLVLQNLPNQDNPWMTGRRPILGVDVWEHAYYLKYQNRRNEYVSAWLKLVHWDYVSAEFKKVAAPA